MKEMGRMITDLLEPRQGRKYQALTADAFGALQLGFNVPHHCLIERGLLEAELAVLAILHFLRQIPNDVGVGLHPT